MFFGKSSRIFVIFILLILERKSCFLRRLMLVFVLIRRFFVRVLLRVFRRKSLDFVRLMSSFVLIMISFRLFLRRRMICLRLF